MPPLSSTTSSAVAMNSPQDQTLAVQPVSSKFASRRLPPPCWSHDETVALIDAYREKWYSLRRGNLRATHWQEVADGVAARCPLGNPPKTSIQCRHKMEKLRKRYRAEIQRIGNTPKGHRYPSSWVHFKLMDSMELGLPSSSDPSVDPNNREDDEEEDDRVEENEEELMLYPKGIKQAIALPLNRRYHSSVNGIGSANGNGNGNGVRIIIPKMTAVPPPSAALNLYNNNRSFDDYPPTVNPHYGPGSGSSFGGVKNRNLVGMKRKVEMENNDNSSNNIMDEMVAAIQKLGDGFVKMERMKMDMARELESMRMNMEMKRTEMILESQQKLVDSFMENKNKKVKRMPTPES